MVDTRYVAQSFESAARQLRTTLCLTTDMTHLTFPTRQASTGVRETRCLPKRSHCERKLKPWRLCVAHCQRAVRCPRITC